MLRADLAALFNVNAATIKVSKYHNEVVFVTLKVDEDQYAELKAAGWHPYPVGRCEDGRKIQFRGAVAATFLRWLMPHLRAAKAKAEHAIRAYCEVTASARAHAKLRKALACCVPAVQLAGC